MLKNKALVSVPNASDILNIYLFLRWAEYSQNFSQFQRNAWQSWRGIITTKQLKSPNLLAVFKNVLIQRISAETTEYVPLHFTLTRSTQDVLSHQQWDLIVQMWLPHACHNTIITGREWSAGMHASRRCVPGLPAQSPLLRPVLSPAGSIQLRP